MSDESLGFGSNNIELTGFRVIDSASMIGVKKIIGNHAKRISELTKKLETLHITLKPIHKREKSEKYEIYARVLDDGKVYASEATDRNLFVALDNVLNKLVNELD